MANHRTPPVHSYCTPATYAERLSRSQDNRENLVHLVFRYNELVAVTRSYESAHQKAATGGRHYRIEVAEVLP